MPSSPLRFAQHRFAEPCDWRSPSSSHGRSLEFSPDSASRQPVTSHLRRRCARRPSMPTRPRIDDVSARGSGLPPTGTSRRVDKYPPSARHPGHDGWVVEHQAGETTFRGGVNIDLGRRHYGLKRRRATYPLGRFTLAGSGFVVSQHLRRTAPYSSSARCAHSDTACVVIRHTWSPGSTFKTPAMVHQIWAPHPGRNSGRSPDCGFPKLLVTDPEYP